MIPEVFRNTIPPAPRGWSDKEWRESFLGKPPAPANAGKALSAGRSWLLAAVIGVVILVFLLVVVLTVH